METEKMDSLQYSTASLPRGV